MNTLLEVKHKLKTQDLFRATTVRALVEECERLSAENAKITAERDALYIEQAKLFAFLYELGENPAFGLSQYGHDRLETLRQEVTK